MSLWEYKVITSGKGGFATPALLEKFLNDLGRDEWEIVHFHTPPDNFLAFTGLVRRSTQRDWTLQDAAAAAAKAETEKLRAEFEAKFKAASSEAPLAGNPPERAPSFLEEKAAPDDGFRKPVDTSRDDDPEAQEDEKTDEWDKLTAAEEDDLPTFFEAIKPHMRRNQRGLGMSVGVDYLAKKWDQSDDDLKGALVECGFALPADEDAKPEYLEYDGDLFWLNVNRRGELWINTKEKPRPVFRAVKAPKAVLEEEPAKPARHGQPARPERQAEEKPETGDRKPETENQKPESGAESGESTAGLEAPSPDSKQKSASGGAGAGGSKLPEGTALLDRIRPYMRRNRRGPGGSGSTGFLSRALRTNESELKSAFVALGLTVPTTPGEKPTYAEIGKEFWWLNVDSRGGLWINGREKKNGETAASAAKESSPDATTDSAASNVGPEAFAPAGEQGASGAAQESISGSESQSEPAKDVSPSVVADAEAAPAPASTPAVSAETSSAETAQERGSAEPAVRHPALAAVRLRLQETKPGVAAGNVDELAEGIGKSREDFLGALVDAGLRVPEKPREKPVSVEYAGEVLWLNKNAKGELWLNAKNAKSADKDDERDGDNPGGEDKPRRGRSRKKETAAPDTRSETEPAPQEN